MTFKHVKFEDSVVMRSLEKLAKEKGLVKEESITKTASKTVTASDNLTENVLTLCAGLRERGFQKQANELETKFMTLKQAQTLYETSSEKGEDLVDAAHPKGSHKLEGVDGDEAVFETILDQHLKNIKMIDKKPTGKLASSKDILGAVKKVLGEGPPAAPAAEISTGLTQPVINYIQGFFKNIDENISSTWDNLFSGVNSEGVVAYNRLKNNMWKHMNAHTFNSTTFAQINGMIDEAISGFSSREAVKLFYRGDGADKAIFQLKNLKNYMNDTAVEDHKKLAAAQADQNKEEGDDKQATEVKKKLAKLIATLGSYKKILTGQEFTDGDRTQMNPKIDEKLAELTQMQSKFNSWDDDKNTQRAAAPGYLTKLTGYEAWAAKVNTWMNS